MGQSTTFAGTTTCLSGTIATNCIGGSKDGVGTNANFYQPNGVVINPVGILMYVADTNNNRIRSIDIAAGE